MSWYQCSAQCFQSSRVLYMGHLVSEWIMRLNSLDSETAKQRNSADEGYLVIFLNQQDSYSWLKLIAGESPEKAIAYNFDFIPDLESEHETK